MRARDVSRVLGIEEVTNEPLHCELLAVDLDGTLLDSQHQVPPRNRAALHRAHEAGIKVVLCTGRSYTETRPILDTIGLDLDAAVTVFGALVNDVATGRTLERSAVPLAVALELTDWMQQRGYTVLWLTDADEAGSDGYVIDGPNRHPAVDRWVERSPCALRCTDSVPRDACAPVRISIIDDTDVLGGVSAALAESFAGRIVHNLLRVPAYSFTVIEAFAAHVNKWYGIKQLCRRWECDPRHTVAIGDDVNDIDMIREAGLGVAMGNAHPRVREVAQQTVADHDECGVAELVERLLA
ncbi:MAG: Cof-type HAD-IIB family hydrolase [Planctomycetes bacterium]|nr:Cof-type HAD-IIB family hydrolase [Planctomycetota bacterium]